MEPMTAVMLLAAGVVVGVAVSYFWLIGYIISGGSREERSDESLRCVDKKLIVSYH